MIITRDNLRNPRKRKRPLGPITDTGLFLFSVVPSPSCPKLFLPVIEPLPDISGRGNAHGLHLLKAGYLADFHRASPHAQGSEQYHYGIFQVARSCFAPTDQAVRSFKNRL